MQTLIIHGRQPELGRAELESLFGPEKLNPVGNIATLLDLQPAEINFMRLGGMVKFCKVLTPLETTDWSKIQKFLEQAVPGHAANLPEGKLQLGISAYGLDVSPKRIMATGLTLKKLLRQDDRSVRFIPNTENALNAAQVLHNGLTRKLGWELVFIREGDKTIVAQSIAVQDIDAYRQRDQERPYRDSKVGMLPPKLAQLIINLAVGNIEKHEVRSMKHAKTVLDPFCGTGVILQESLLMGYGAYGTDLEPRMVDYSQKNLDWLTTAYSPPAGCAPLEPNDSYLIEQGDATKYKWSKPFDVIACETYLGRPLSSLPEDDVLDKIANDCDTIHTKFLQNFATQAKSGFRLCIAVPAWKTNKGFINLTTLDKLDNLGYNRIKFVHAPNLIYHRPGQIVGRELVVLERK